MWIARGGTSFGSSSIWTTAGFGNGFSAYVIDKRGLTFDTRFVPADSRATDNGQLLFLFAGRFEVTEPAQRDFVGPALLRMAESQFEGAEGTRPMHFRATGEHYLSLDLRFAREYLTTPPPDVPAIVELGEVAWSAARRAVAADAAQMHGALVELIEQLVQRGVVHARLADRARRPAPGPRRLWSAVRPLLERFDAVSTLQEIAVEAGRSPRSTARDIKAFLAAFPFVASGWREFILRSRIKLATQGLSSAHTTIGEVAATCGYGSSEAMARAFRDAGLPAPSVVRKALRGETS